MVPPQLTVKTEVRIVGKDTDVMFLFNGTEISEVCTYKYVGTIYSSKGPSFNDYDDVISQISGANRAIHKVHSYCKCLGQTPVTAATLFNSSGTYPRIRLWSLVSS